MNGYVRGRGLQLGKGFGFIAADDGQDYFVHRSKLIDLEWDETIAERGVEFDVEQTDRGKAAVNVRAA